jgi:hypothetical protein
MYGFVLILHSWLRWAAIITGAMATLSALKSDGRTASSDRVFSDRALSDPSDRWGLAFMVSLDLQMLLGLLLYLVLSPNTAAMFNDFGTAIRDPVTRFWAVEHVGTMMFAVVLVHVGRALARKATSPGAKHARLLICFGVALVAILAATPWPGMANGRPLFRV